MRDTPEQRPGYPEQRPDQDRPRARRDGMLRPSGGYRSLRSFQMAEIIFDATVAFCKTHRAELGLRYCEQMVQAAPALDTLESLANLRPPMCRHHIFPAHRFETSW